MEFSRPEYWTGSLSLLQGILPTQGLNPGLPHCRQNSLPAKPQGKPKNTGVGFSLDLKPKNTIPSPVDVPDPGIQPGSPALQVDSLPTELSGKPAQFALNNHPSFTHPHCPPKENRFQC